MLSPWWCLPGWRFLELRAWVQTVESYDEFITKKLLTVSGWRRLTFPAICRLGNLARAARSTQTISDTSRRLNWNPSCP